MGKRNPIDLDEALAIIYMFMKEGMTKQEVSRLTGRSPGSLNYRFLENEIVSEGKSLQRSFKAKFGGKDSQGLKGVYEYFNVPYVDEVDVQRRIENYRERLQQEIKSR